MAEAASVPGSFSKAAAAMRLYRVYKSPDGSTVRLKMGFSWHAFFIGSFKAMLRRTWLLLGVAAFFLLSMAWSANSPTSSTRTAAVAAVIAVFYVVFMLFCGFNGARWAGDSLRRRGYTLIGEEQGRSAASAASRSNRAGTSRPARRGGRGRSTATRPRRCRQ